MSGASASADLETIGAIGVAWIAVWSAAASAVGAPLPGSRAMTTDARATAGAPTKPTGRAVAGARTSEAVSPALDAGGDPADDETSGFGAAVVMVAGSSGEGSLSARAADVAGGR